MKTVRDSLKMEGKSSSLEDCPCKSVCTLTYLTPENDTCICGRTTKEIAQWNCLDTVKKKEIVMRCIVDKKSFPRQKLTWLAEENDLTVNEAKNVFVLRRTK